MGHRTKLQKTNLCNTNCQLEPLTRVNDTVRSVDVPDPCENWVSTPGKKRIIMESYAKIKLLIMSVSDVFVPLFL